LIREGRAEQAQVFAGQNLVAHVVTESATTASPAPRGEPEPERMTEPVRYDFDRIIDRRRTNSEKWDLVGRLFGTEDALPMWVADMDFPCPEPVLEALRKRLDHPILGYGFPPDSLYEAVIDRMARRFGWTVEKEWITFTPGVVTAIYAAVRAISEPGDEIVLQPPVYHPFFSAVIDNGCQVVPNRLKLEEPGELGGAGPGPRYVMDLEDLARRFSGAEGFGARPHRIKGLILCSPHNPVGRVWTPDELRRLSELCLANGCVVISDEIHCDLMIGESRHTPTAALSPETARNTITLMAPSKTFNLAGLEASFAVIPDPQLRRRFEEARRGQSGVNVLGLVAMEAALRDGDDYLDQLNAYLTENVRCFAEAVAGIPGVRLVPARGPEGTYLAWVDLRGLGVEDAALEDFMFRRARLATDPGYIFGPGGEGFHRVNLACPRSIVREAVQRLRAAVERLGA